MNKKIKLSIIIPVYNVAPYVEKCLRSCAEQDLSQENYEIIVINDGTPDNSLEIVERVAKDYSNIIIHSQENQGLSAARNKGLSLAKGEYVWFVDSDDWIKTDCLKEITEKCTTLSLDALGICAANVIDNDVVKRFDHQVKGVISGKQALICGKMNVQVPFTIYRRLFLLENNLYMKIGIFHEDSEFTPRAYYHVKKVSFIDKVFYFIHQNPDSITRTPNPKKAFDCIFVANSLSAFSQTIEKELLKRFDYIISMNINNSLNNTYEMSTQKRKELNQYIYEHKNLFNHLLRSKVLKYKMEGLLFNLWPKNTVEVYQFIQKFNI